MRRNTVKLLLAGSFVLSLLVGWASEGPTATQTKNIFLGATSSSSGYFPVCVTNARIINRNIPEVRVTVLETGAAHDNIQRIGKGQAQLADVTGYDAVVLAYQGLYQYKNKAMKNLRILFLEGKSFLSIVVRADSGVKNLADLQGKRFHTGIHGTTAEFTTRLLLEQFGIKPVYVYGSLADAIEMVKEGRVVGLSKSSAAASGALDASVLEIKSFTPVRLVSLTEEEMKKALQLIPGQGRFDLPSGNPFSKSVGQEEPLLTLTMAHGMFGTSELSEELVYKMIRAIVTNWKTDLAPVRADLRDWEVMEKTIEVAAEVATPVPLHAGVVKYFTEKGFKVPTSIIPPEWKK